MALFRRNKLSPEWQFWLGPLPNIIPPESGHSSGFRQESVGQGKDLTILFPHTFIQNSLCVFLHAHHFLVLHWQFNLIFCLHHPLFLDWNPANLYSLCHHSFCLGLSFFPYYHLSYFLGVTQLSFHAFPIQHLFFNILVVQHRQQLLHPQPRLLLPNGHSILFPLVLKGPVLRTACGP